MITAKWPNLTQLNIGNSDSMQRATISETKGVSTLAVQNGLNLPKSTYVPFGSDSGNNSIGDEGCLHLSRAQWTHLTQINLGFYRMTQGETKLEMQDANTSAVSRVPASKSST